MTPALHALPWVLISKWVALCITAIAFGVWHYKQDMALSRRITQLTQKPAPLFDAVKLSHARSQQSLVLMMFCLVLVAIFDLTGLKWEKGSMHAEARRSRTPIEATPPAVAELDAALANPVDPEAIEMQLDAVKEAFEGGFISYYFMARCGIAEGADFELIRNALLAALQALGAQGALGVSMARDIEEAGRGSYSELYARSPCDNDTIERMEPAYRRYITALTSQMR